MSSYILLFSELKSVHLYIFSPDVGLAFFFFFLSIFDLQLVESMDGMQSVYADS
jgi:hypothetical protein